MWSRWLHENKQGKQVRGENPPQSHFARHRSHHNLTWNRTPATAVGGGTHKYRLADMKISMYFAARMHTKMLRLQFLYSLALPTTWYSVRE